MGALSMSEAPFQCPALYPDLTHFENRFLSDNSCCDQRVCLANLGSGPLRLSHRPLNDSFYLRLPPTTFFPSHRLLCEPVWDGSVQSSRYFLIRS